MSSTVDPLETSAPPRWRIGSLPVRRSAAAWFALIFVLLVASRIVLAPQYLVTFDEINFALSVHDFNPALHQPQPPGYPLFVALLRAFSIFVPGIENLFLAVAIFGSMLALLLTWAAGDRLLGKGTGLIAALLLLFHPSFWYAALTNPIRVFLAAGGAGVAFCLIRAMSSKRKAAWYYLASFVFGIATGFRPDLLFTLSPLLLYAAWQLRLTLRQAALAVLIVAAAISVWLLPLALPMGGLLAFWRFMRAYWNSQGASTSVLLGAPILAALGMAYTTTVWTFTGALSWIWCVPFTVRNCRRAFTRPQVEFLLVWLLSGFLFYSLVHTGDPDHPLSIVPVTCLAGAVMLKRFAARYAPRYLSAVTGAAIALNVFLFFKPLGPTSEAASYGMVRSLDQNMQQLVISLDALRATAPVTVVSDAFMPSWRNASYYFPEMTMLVVDSGSPDNPHGGKWVQHHRSPLPVDQGVVLLPGCGTIAWLDNMARPVVKSNGKMLTGMTGAPLTFSKAKPGDQYSFRQFSFRVNDLPCR